MKFKVGQTVRCVSDITNRIDPGTVLSIEKIGYFGVITFIGTTQTLQIDEIEPLNKTIRDVEIGDIIIDDDNDEYKVIDVGTKGFVDEDDCYYMFEDVEIDGWEIKQEEIVELTLEEVAKLKGIKVENLRIKDAN